MADSNGEFKLFESKIQVKRYQNTLNIKNLAPRAKALEADAVILPTINSAYPTKTKKIKLDFIDVSDDLGLKRQLIANSLAISPDGNHLLINCNVDLLQYDLIQSKFIKLDSFQSKNLDAKNILINPSKKLLITAKYLDVVIYNYLEGKKIFDYSLGKYVGPIAQSGNGEYFAVGSHQYLKIFSLQNMKEVFSLDENFKDIRGQHISAFVFEKEKLWASCNESLLEIDLGGKNPSVTTHSFKNLIGEAQPYGNHALNYHDQNNQLIIGNTNGSISFFDLGLKKVTSVINNENGGHHFNITNLVISPNKRYLVSGDSRHNIKIFDLKENCKKVFEVNDSYVYTEENSTPLSMVITSDGKLIHTGTLNSIKPYSSDKYDFINITEFDHRFLSLGSIIPTDSENRIEKPKEEKLIQ